MHALISVSDKKDVAAFALGLLELGYSLLSTGGTLKTLAEAGIAATQVSEHTQSPEILGGRVKTLHPRIHGGILARLNLQEDLDALKKHDIPPISLVVVNLYPFRQTVASGASEDEIIEQIDIGGPAMIRAAAKNVAHVTVVVDPDDYPLVLEELKSQRTVSESTRKLLMRKAFAHTAAYDASISRYLQEQAGEPFPIELSVTFLKSQSLRYGENPHQRGALYRTFEKPNQPTVAHARILQGKELSFNNLLDLDAALRIILEFPEQPTAVIVKHNTPCGVAVSKTLTESYRSARAIDEVSAFGGIVALNRSVDASTAKALAETFLEAVIAPSFSEESLRLLSAKKNLRLLAVGDGVDGLGKPQPSFELRSIAGGLLVQDRDSVEPPLSWKVVTRRIPSEEDERAMHFAWRVCKHVKSNAIVFADGTQLLAAGGGQTSRVDSVKIAVGKGGSSLKGSAVASDAFFPFRDGVDEIAKSGATCIIQPGGSVRDAEIVAAADEHNLAMVLTGVRHFRH